MTVVEQIYGNVFDQVVEDKKEVLCIEASIIDVVENEIEEMERSDGNQ